MKEPERQARKLVKMFQFDCSIETGCRPLSVMNISKLCALICIKKQIEENRSILNLVKVHGNERTELPLNRRIDELIEISEEIKKL